MCKLLQIYLSKLYYIIVSLKVEKTGLSWLKEQILLKHLRPTMFSGFLKNCWTNSGLKRQPVPGKQGSPLMRMDSSRQYKEEVQPSLERWEQVQLSFLPWLWTSWWCLSCWSFAGWVSIHLCLWLLLWVGSVNHFIISGRYLWIWQFAFK